MQFIPLETLAAAASWARQVAMFDVPVPDVALIGAPALMICAMWVNARARVAQARQQVMAYQAELLNSNRRAQQARAELGKAEREIERERQKRRRESNRAVARPAPKRALVDMRDRTAQPQTRAGETLDRS